MLDDTAFSDLYAQIARVATRSPVAALNQALALARETYEQAHVEVQRLQTELDAATVHYRTSDNLERCLQELDSAGPALEAIGLKTLHARLRGELLRLDGALKHHYAAGQRIRTHLDVEKVQSAQLAVKLARRVDGEVVEVLSDLIERIRNKALD